MTSHSREVSTPQWRTPVENLGEPVPGYQGVNRRIQADNLFGMTYAECRRKGVDSHGKIIQEKGETLRQTQHFMPEWNQPKEDPYLF